MALRPIYGCVGTVGRRNGYPKLHIGCRPKQWFRHELLKKRSLAVDRQTRYVVRVTMAVLTSSETASMVSTLHARNREQDSVV